MVDGTSSSWADDDDDETLQDEAGRQAANRLRGQLELFPELEPPVDNPGQRASFIIKPANLRDAARATKLSSRNIDKKSALGGRRNPRQPDTHYCQISVRNLSRRGTIFTGLDGIA